MLLKDIFLNLDDIMKNIKWGAARLTKYVYVCLLILKFFLYKCGPFCFVSDDTFINKLS